MVNKLRGKEIGAIITFIVMIPIIFGLINFTIKNAQDPGNPDNLEEGMVLVVDASIP